MYDHNWDLLKFLKKYKKKVESINGNILKYKEENNSNSF